MSFERWGYQFKGSFTNPNLLESRSGVYVIWCQKGEVWTVLDVGESADVKNRVLNHDRKPCWENHCTGTLYYTATYTPNLQQIDRMGIEQRIRDLVRPPCGEK